MVVGRDRTVCVPKLFSTSCSFSCLPGFTIRGTILVSLPFTKDMFESKFVKTVK